MAKLPYGWYLLGCATNNQQQVIVPTNKKLGLYR